MLILVARMGVGSPTAATNFTAALQNCDVRNACAPLHALPVLPLHAALYGDILWEERLRNLTLSF